jgi:Matrixin
MARRRIRVFGMILRYGVSLFSTLLLPFIMGSLLLSAATLSSVTTTSLTSVMASTDGNLGTDDQDQGENTRDIDEDDDSNNDVDDGIDLDELNLLHICCAWSGKLSDGTLEYSISGEGDGWSRQAVLNAIQDWDLLIENLVFIEIQDNDASDDPDVEIGFSNIDEDADGEEYDSGDSVAAGVTHLRLDNEGFVDSIEVTLSEGIFGNRFESSALEQVARHEIGHVLGLGHANFDGSLMSESTEGGERNISSCEFNGVLAANHWKLVDGGDGPEYPEAHFVVC